MATKITVEGLDALKRRLRTLGRGMRAGASDGQQAAARSIAEDWRDLAPVDTGEYRDSIEFDDDSVFSRDPKSPFVEFGTSTHVPQPAGSEAAARGQAKMPGQVGAEVRKRLP